MTEQSDEIRTVASEIGKLLYGFPFTNYSACLVGPPLIFACIGFNSRRTSKEKQQVILQCLFEISLSLG